MRTSAVRVTLDKIPGTRYLCSLLCRSGRKMAKMSERPTSAVSNAAVRGTQTCWRLRSAK